MTNLDVPDDDVMLEVKDLTKNFVKRLDLAGKIARKLGSDIREETVFAVDKVSFTICNIF